MMEWEYEWVCKREYAREWTRNEWVYKWVIEGVAGYPSVIIKIVVAFHLTNLFGKPHPKQFEGTQNSLFRDAN